MDSMRITDWPAKERPRERLPSYGPPGLSDAELLAILLRTGARGRSALDLARHLISRHNGLRQLFEISCETFCELPGLGPAKYAQLQAALELARRCRRARLERGEPLTSPQFTGDYLG